MSLLIMLIQDEIKKTRIKSKIADVSRMCLLLKEISECREGVERYYHAWKYLEVSDGGQATRIWLYNYKYFVWIISEASSFMQL